MRYLEAEKAEEPMRLAGRPHIKIVNGQHHTLVLIL